MSSAIACAQIAARGIASISVMVNGNPELANDLKNKIDKKWDGFQNQSALADFESLLNVWSIPIGDKSNAWNQYIHQIWSGEEIVFFVDGYVQLLPDAIEVLGTVVAADVRALGGSGMPSMGRSAARSRQALSSESGLHGNFCCIKGTVLRRMVERQINLPIGLYRGDSFFGAILCYDLDPQSNIWEDFRIAVVSTASWHIVAKHWWRWGDIRDYFKRLLRQVRGDLEKRALRESLTFRRIRPELLPANARELVLDWTLRCPDDWASASLGRPMALVAFWKIQRDEPVSGIGLKPRLVFGKQLA